MIRTKQNWFRRSLSLLMALMMCIGMIATTAFAAETKQTVPETYIVPITSLTSGAPLPAVQTAFAGAFGDQVTVIVNEDGSKIAVIKNYHMIIDLMGNKYDANVVSVVDADMTLDGVQSATVLSTKEEVYTNGMGGGQEPITVPDEFTIPLNLDENNSQKISITVDFMDAFLGGGNPYPTTVTLTLDMENAKQIIDTKELEQLIANCEQISSENYTEESFSVLTEAILKAQKIVDNPKSVNDVNAMIEELTSAKNSLVYLGADYSAVDAVISKIPANSSIYTEESWKALMDAKNAVQNGLDITQQAVVDGYVTAIENAISGLILKNADYSKVDAALASVPQDLSEYTDKSANEVKKAVDAVERGLKADEQNKVDSMAEAIQKAVAALEKNPLGETVDLSKPGKYLVPIKSLTSAAPLPAVQAGFSKAFGDSAIITVYEDGSKIVTVTNNHMVIDMSAMGLSKFDANVTRIDGATVLSTKEEVFSNVNGSLANTPVSEKITVPKEASFPLNTDSNGSQKLTVGVDFMAKMSGMDIDDYSTVVTLTLGLDEAKLIEDETSNTPEEPNPEKPTVPSDPTQTDNPTKPSNSNDTNEPASNQTIDIKNLADGMYEIPVALWHATENRESMAAKSLNSTARIVVKNGKKTVYIYTGPMTFGNITASLQEMKVQMSDGSWINAVIESKSSSGDPTCFSFNIDEISEYINVKVNPHVEMMGNQDLDARLKFSTSEIKLVSENTDNKPITPPANSGNTDEKSPQTGDISNIEFWFALMMASAGAMIVTVVKRKKMITQ